VVQAPSFDGTSTIFYNLRNGVGFKIKSDLATRFDQLAKIKPMDRVLEKYKFARTETEAQDVYDEYVQKQEYGQPLHLVIMPHQNCNFRCVYCYEKFDKNKMEPHVEAGIVQFVQARLQTGQYRVFSVSWFGGEPLLATDVIERLSTQFQELCAEYGVSYVATLTSNGYGLDERTIDMLLARGVKSFQITIDGTKECHDHQRLLKGGQPTYDRIVSNLQMLSTRSAEFLTIIRMNVGADNLPVVGQHIEEMKAMFGHDARFQMFFKNIGHWGGEHDEEVDICSENISVKLTEMTIDHEMNALPIAVQLRTGSTCYAASPHSFVFGVDGMVYKCTVALYDERNHVGQLREDGTLELDEARMRLWTHAGSQDAGCKQCFFSPVCHGDSCPLVRLEEDRRPCPDTKRKVRDVLTLMDRQGHPFIEIN
jgi:uncharacterized protein